ncbi:MAG: UDP-N-acetylmuramoyl-L-alanyl-D-glutamate--2,6-diaminopimelate ligase [Candidatus Gracilibacteria bacterium]|nr:UDP-N-acetylmuramoyl-L-alanyl-D-glutamate--2,6-diaminopimelate ligase [Candidatus Gracilibacteria bacterium]
MLSKLKKLISLDNPLRLGYHLIRAVIANFIYGFPSKGMIIIGITGTNGKTTTTNIIARGLINAGKKVFMFSTVNYIIADKEYRNDTKMTTPDVFLLQRLLLEAKKAGCEIAVIETASHGIAMHRNWGIDYDIAVLTNITRDHLDLHKTMDNYVRTKLKLFKSLISSERKTGVKKTAIINIESEYKDLFLNETYDVLTTYGLDYDSNLKPINIVNGLDYVTFELKIPDDILKIKTRLRGKHNIYNILGAIGVFLSLGLKPRVIEKSIAEVEVVPGRLEEVKNYEGFKIFIDYAHTPDALEKVLSTLKEIEGIKRIIIVFGATGDRDKTKRPIMGKIVSQMSDFVILTQDDDYTEKTNSIIKDVLPGIERKEGENFWIIPDRQSAIRTALIEASENDVVLIAGKGDEHLMMTNDGPVDYNDKEEVIKILKEIDDNKVM